MIYRWKHVDWWCHALGIIFGFAKIIDGCVIVFTLGFLGSGFSLRIAALNALESHKRSLRR